MYWGISLTPRSRYALTITSRIKYKNTTTPKSQPHEHLNSKTAYASITTPRSRTRALVAPQDHVHRYTASASLGGTSTRWCIILSVHTHHHHHHPYLQQDTETHTRTSLSSHNKALSTQVHFDRKPNTTWLICII